MQKAIIVVLVLIVAVLGYIVFQQNYTGNKDAAIDAADTISVEKDLAKGKGGRKKKKPFVNLHIDSLAIHKADRVLLAFSKQNLVLQYNIALGVNPVGKKEVEGDYKTPEGLYHIDGKNPLSHYYKALGVSYPNDEDKAHAKELGQKPGGDIKIHGLMKKMNNPGKLHIKSDWTWGCIAITNEEIDELYAQVKVGTPVFITP